MKKKIHCDCSKYTERYHCRTRFGTSHCPRHCVFCHVSSPTKKTIEFVNAVIQDAYELGYKHSMRDQRKKFSPMTRQSEKKGGERT